MSSKALELAGSASTAQNGASTSGTEVVAPLTPEMELRLDVARLYGRGFTRGQIAKSLAKRLAPQAARKDRQSLLRAARNKLWHWEQQQSFRDLVWQHAQIKLDMASPQITDAIVKSAKKGRVDAAKLALEIAGRHSSHENMQVTAVQVNIANGIPRPT